MKRPTSRNPLQFGVRHLLTAMLVIAMVSAVLAPWIRDLTRGQWLRLAASLGLTVAAFVAVSLLHAKLYLGARQRLGDILWEVTGAWRGPGRKGVRLVPYFLLSVAALTAIVLSAFTFAIPNEETTKIVLLLSVEVGGSAAIGIQWLRCPLDLVLIGEHGIVASNEYVPWSDVCCSWKTGGKSAPILLRISGLVVYELDVPAETEELVAKYVQRRANAWNGKTAGG